jgi:putative hemolysin
MTTQLRVVSAIAAALALAACATATPNVKPNATSAAASKNPACVSQTGSRIPVERADCTAFGRSYSGDDLDRTGRTTVGDALAVLDPSITVHH